MAGCGACEDNFPAWVSLRTRLIKIHPKIQVVVADLSRVKRDDTVDRDLRPDVRLVPTAETILAHRLHQAPMTVLIMGGVYRAVKGGSLNKDDITEFGRILGR